MIQLVANEWLVNCKIDGCSVSPFGWLASYAVLISVYVNYTGLFFSVQMNFSILIFSLEKKNCPMFLGWISSHLLLMGIFRHLCTHKIRWVNAMINSIRMIMVSESSSATLRFSYYFVMVALSCFNIWNLTFPNGFQMNFFLFTVSLMHCIKLPMPNETLDSLARQIIMHVLSWCCFCVGNGIDFMNHAGYFRLIHIPKSKWLVALEA